MCRLSWMFVALSGMLVASGPVAAAEWGNLKGRFVYDGAAPSPVALLITKDVEVCGKYPGETVDQSLLIGGENGLRNVFIYLKAKDDALPEVHPDIVTAAEKPAKIDNTHCMFYPHAIGLWAGKQSLLVVNNDPIGQAAKIDTSKNAPLNALVPIGGQIEHKFDVGESLPKLVSCGVHPWETAYLLIHNSPYFAVSDKNGNFVMPNLPAGEWTFQVWHEKVGYLVAKPEWEKGRFTMTIQPGDNDLGTIEVAPSLFDK